MLPRMMKNFNVFVDGENFVGRCTECTLPDIVLNTDEYKGGGMDVPVDLEQGMQKLDCMWTLAEYNEATIKKFGLFNADTLIVFKGAMQRQGEGVVKFEVRMRGGLKEMKRDPLKPERSNMMLTANLNTYVEIIGEETVIDIDVLNMKRIIGGVDQLAQQRAALGL